MKSFLAYVLLVMWLPNIAGTVAALAVQLPVAWMTPIRKDRPDRTDTLIWQTLESVGGFVAVWVGLCLFRLLSAKISLAIPLIIGAWATWYYFNFRKPKWEWVCWLLGEVVGWWLLAPSP